MAATLKGVAETYFDGWVAEHYEQLWPHLFAPEVVEPTVDCLRELAGGGACLEFGVGSRSVDRVAQPEDRVASAAADHRGRGKVHAGTLTQPDRDPLDPPRLGTYL